MEFIRRVYEDGKITIPKELRKLWGVREGDYVRLRLVGTVPPEPASSDATDEART